MGEKDDGSDLSLSLGLVSFGRDDLNNRSSDQRPRASSRLAVTASPFPLNLFKSSLLNNNKSRSSTDGIFQAPTADLNKDPRLVFRGIDMNRSVTITDCEEENLIVSSPNSTVSSLSGKRSEREEKDDGERASSSLEVDEDGGDAAARKKLRLSKEQAVILEETFKERNTLNPKEKIALAKQLNLMPRQVEVWFQNRRARTKLKQTEVDCEYLRRCCDNLTEENRRLQKEVSELRALKLSPQFYMNLSPPTTLTMCPQCERVAVSSASSSSTTSPSAVAASSHHQRPVGVNPWAAIISPQSTDPPHRPRT